MGSGIYLFNIFIDLAGLVLCVTSILQIRIGIRVDERMDRYFLMFFRCLILFTMANAIGQALRGHPGAWAYAALRAANFIEFLMPCLLFYFVSLYLLFVVDPAHRRKKLRSVFALLVIIHALLLVVSQFTGWYYVIDSSNVYHRSSLYPLSYVMTAIMVVTDMYLLAVERSKFSSRELSAFWIYLTVPSIAAGVQLLVYGIYFVVFATIVAAMVMYVFMLEDRTARYYQQIEENTQLKENILISQVQPHFIFNSLTAIRSLCDMDSEAYEAIGHFAGFLRGSLDILNEKDCIPFNKEINTVGNYLYMEKLRFDDKLQVITDFEDRSFSLPACSIQILAENAVKHGIRKNSSGCGTLSIRSYETGDAHVVEVQDDGTGFEPDERTGRGIRTLRRRLEIMCGGELIIDSQKGKGTKAVIRIPKEGEVK